MTPLEFFQYSLMAAVDVLVLLFLIGIARALFLDLVRNLIKFYFAEREEMYKRMSQVPSPPDYHKIH